MRKIVAAAALVVCAVLTMSSPSMSGDLSPVGQWRSTSGEARYEVVPCGDQQICARLTWLRADARTEQNMAHLNKYVLRGAYQTSPNKWSGTVNYDGQAIAGTMSLQGASKLKLSGCKLVFCKTLTFERI